MAALSGDTPGRIAYAVANVATTGVRAGVSGDWYVNRETVEVDLHQVGTILEGSHEFSVPASNTPTRIYVTSNVSAQAVRDAKTAAAVALDRRRKATKLGKLVTVLPAKAGEPDFHTYAHPVFGQVRTLLSELAPYDRFEGNTCMILRYIRNSFIHPGWERYREKEVASAVSDILHHLGSVESVKRQDAKAAFAKLHELKLRAALPISLIADADEREDGDGVKEEKKVAN